MTILRLEPTPPIAFGVHQVYSFRVGVFIDATTKAITETTMVKMQSGQIRLLGVWGSLYGAHHIDWLVFHWNDQVAPKRRNTFLLPNKQKKG